VIIAISFTLFFIVLRFTVTLFNFISNPKLTRVNRQYHDLVSILIPARNEEENILTLLQSICNQDYADFEVIVYDDQSEDRTYRIAAAFAEKHPRFRVVKGTDLQDGWVGKNYACFQLAKQAKGRYFLFLDADTSINKNLLNSAVHRMHLHKLALLSLFVNQDMETIGEKLTVPLLHYLLLNMLPLRLLNLLKGPAGAIACGQFMLFDAIIYRQKEWHKMVKSKVVEDAEIMKMIKTEAYCGEVLLANQMMQCRMYRNLKDAVNGFSKNVLALFNYSIPGILTFITVLFGGPMLVFITLNFDLIFFMCGLIILSRLMVSLTAGQNVFYNIILHPFQIIMLVLIGFLSIQKHLTKTNIWKGRSVAE